MIRAILRIDYERERTFFTAVHIKRFPGLGRLVIVRILLKTVHYDPPVEGG